MRAIHERLNAKRPMCSCEPLMAPLPALTRTSSSSTSTKTSSSSPLDSWLGGLAGWNGLSSDGSTPSASAITYSCSRLASLTPRSMRPTVLKCRPLRWARSSMVRPFCLRRSRTRAPCARASSPTRAFTWSSSGGVLICGVTITLVCANAHILDTSRYFFNPSGV
ncbi:Uncharacterised protein [Mycobacterium tuberculosis]|nr:Uncharacterised protein [Mycobacterium tuberculosis]